MPLPGNAAMLLFFDVVRETVPEHDEWHTHEHLPERLSIPGFVRGTRWVALHEGPRYFVMYEVEQLATLTSKAYLERLNNPTPWISKMMPSYRGMTRGFCSVTGSFGAGIGQAGLVIRLRPPAGEEAPARKRLLQDILPGLAARRGIGSAHLFEGAATPPMTNEQRIRGADAGVAWALLVTGYDHDAMTGLTQADLSVARFEAQGAMDVTSALYRLEYSLNGREVNA